MNYLKPIIDCKVSQEYSKAVDESEIGARFTPFTIECGRSYTRHNYVDGFKGTVAFIIFKITDAVKSIFGASLWQQTQKVLADHFQKTLNVTVPQPLENEEKSAEPAVKAEQPADTELSDADIYKKLKGFANEYLKVIKNTYSKEQKRDLVGNTQEIVTKDTAKAFMQGALEKAKETFTGINKIILAKKSPE